MNKHPNARPCVIRWTASGEYLAAPPRFGVPLTWTEEQDSAHRYSHWDDARDDAFFAWLSDWPHVVEIVSVEDGR